MDRNRWIGPFAIVALTCAVYAAKVTSPFQWDDFHFIVRNHLVQDPANILQFFTDGHEGLYRPLRAVVYMLLAQVPGRGPVPYHLAGIGFHVATVLLVYGIVRRIFGSRSVALASGLLFGVHPVLTGRVANVTASLDIPGVTLALLAFWLLIRRRIGTANTNRICPASLGAFAAGVLYSEEAATLVPMVFAYGFAFDTENGRRPWRGAVLLAAPYLVVLAAYLVLRTFMLGTVGRVDVGLSEYLIQVLGMGIIFWRYVIKLLFPVYLTPDYGLSATDAGSAEIGIAILLIALLVALALLLLRRGHPAGFSIAWFFSALLPFSNLIPTGSLMADRYLYHAAAAFLATMAGLLNLNGLLRRRRVRALVLVVLSLFCLLAFHRIHLWSSPLLLWEDAASHAPGSYVSRINHGIALRQAGSVDLAEEQFQEAVRIAPNEPKAYVNLGQMYMESGRYRDAGAVFRKALDASPEHVPALAGMANLMVVAGDLAEARKLAERALTFDTENVSVHNVLAFVAVQQGRIGEAIQRYEFVTRHAFDPRLAEGARHNLDALRRRQRQEQ